jgi:hypothetical protein
MIVWSVTLLTSALVGWYFYVDASTRNNENWYGHVISGLGLGLFFAFVAGMFAFLITAPILAKAGAGGNKWICESIEKYGKSSPRLEAILPDILRIKAQLPAASVFVDELEDDLLIAVEYNGCRFYV